MSVRVRVDLEAFGHPPEWMLIDPTQTPTLNDVIIKLSNKLGISSDIRMRLDGCLLPNEESVGLLQSGDLVEAVNHSEARPPSKRAKVESPPNEGGLEVVAGGVSLNNSSGSRSVGHALVKPGTANPKSTQVSATTQKPNGPPRKQVGGKVTGIVKFYSARKKYGFITRSDTKKDVFVHQTAISNRNAKWLTARSLGDGELVEFDVVKGSMGEVARNVTGPGGASVKGSSSAETADLSVTKASGKYHKVPNGQKKKKNKKAKNVDDFKFDIDMIDW